ncbi:MAG: sensor domain-containing diguanylate cyclase [Coriobacteriia bacterium]|nr:sensor domain-containing diguanylate cyclase [Coriobacteriia bacterium]
MTRAPETAKNARATRFSAEERAYLLARFLLILTLAALYATGIMSGESVVDHRLYLGALALLAVNSAVLLVMLVGPFEIPVERSFLIIAIPDLLAFGAMSYLGKPDDSFYPVIAMAPIFYALVASRRNALIVGCSAAIAYVVGVSFIGAQTTADWILFGAKAIAVPLVTYIVATAVARQRDRESMAGSAAAETEHLNALLRKRIQELQAVSDITEMVHSSLDFDSVGTQVLDIVAKAINVDTCSVFVIDKERSETMFSASRGTATPISSPEELQPFGESVESHLTCVPVFDHGKTMVLFCTIAEALEALTDDERSVLSAVASELVVAVENSRLYKLTSKLAITDELTDLANYRHLQQRLDEEIARATRYSKHLSLLMLDADDFKAFNDSEGHVAGDDALAELGAVMRSAVREVDLVARYGGEEFSVVLPETDVAGAFIVAEKIREAVEVHRFKNSEGGRNCQLTISAGLATFPTHSKDKDSLLREADDALYHAKNGGKNRVRAPKRSKAVTVLPVAESDAPADEWTGV